MAFLRGFGVFQESVLRNGQLQKVLRIWGCEAEARTQIILKRFIAQGKVCQAGIVATTRDAGLALPEKVVPARLH